MSTKQTFWYSFLIDGYLIGTESVSAISQSQAKQLIRSRYRGRKLSSFVRE